MRTKATIDRLNMYKNFKAVRNRQGKVIKAAPTQGWLASGTRARVEPNRKWFGKIFLFQCLAFRLLLSCFILKEIAE